MKSPNGLFCSCDSKNQESSFVAAQKNQKTRDYLASR